MILLPAFKRLYQVTGIAILLFVCFFTPFTSIGKALATNDTSKLTKYDWKLESNNYPTGVKRRLNDVRFSPYNGTEFILFKEPVSFSYSKFGGKLSMYAHFEDSVVFMGDQFAAVNFSRSVFKKDADFTHANFSNLVDFSSAKFCKKVDFSQDTISKTIKFFLTQFGPFADFWKVSLSENTQFVFNYATLPDLIDFSGIGKLYQQVNFTDATLDNDSLENSGKWHYINIYQTDVTLLRIDYDHFRVCFYDNNSPDKALIKYLNFKEGSLTLNGKDYNSNDKELVELLLTDCTFRHYLKKIFPTARPEDRVVKIFVKHWLGCNNFPNELTEDQTISVYEQLLKTFDSQGQKESYEKLDIEYRDFKSFWWFIPHYWYCYGYHKGYIFYWTGLFLILLTFFTYIFYFKLKCKVAEGGAYYIEHLHNDGDNSANTPFLRRVRYAFLYTSTIFFLFSLKMENLNLNKKSVFYIIAIYSIGLLCIGYLANFILQK